MDPSSLKIPKKPQPVTLWVHPEGCVVGSIFLHFPDPESNRGEQPLDVINEPTDFMVIRRDDPEGLRFYNKCAIVRLEYVDPEDVDAREGKPLPCRVTLMDGSLMDGEMCKATPAERSRLYDYVNASRDRFLKLHFGKGEIALVNKSYIVCISPLEDRVAGGGSIELAA